MGTSVWTRLALAERLVETLDVFGLALVIPVWWLACDEQTRRATGNPARHSGAAPRDQQPRAADICPVPSNLSTKQP